MTDSIWLSEPYTPRPSLSGKHSTHVVIAGGGLTGVLLAYHLSKEKVPSLVLEKNVLGSGASGRNAGFVMTGDHYHYVASRNVFGPDRAKTVWQLTQKNRELLASLIAAESLDCGFRRTGSLRAATTESEASQIRKSVEALRSDGFDVEWRTRDLGSDKYFGAMFVPGDGEIHPVKFVRGLARTLTVYENSPIVGYESRGAEIFVRTASGEVHAALLVLGTNAYSAQVHGFFEDCIFPVRGQIMATEPVAERVIPCPTYLNFGQEYVRQLSTGEILAGGGRRLEGKFTTTTDDSPTVNVQQFLDEYLHEVYPRTRSARVVRRWGGLMGFSCDELPNVGFLPGAVNTFVCAGYTGHGLGLSTILTRMAADLIVRGTSDLPFKLFDPRRHT